MNRIFRTSVLLLALFLLTACADIPDEILDIIPDDVIALLPSVEIAGDDLIIIEQYTEFVDPGAQIIGDFDLDITVIEDVDTDIVGTYTITYSTEYLGTTYSIDRTVTVVDSVLFNLGINISDITITNTAVSFTVSLDDTAGDLTDPVVVLYQGSTVVRSYPLSNGDTVITIDKFSANTDYRISVEGSYLVGSIVQYIEGYEVSFTSPNVDLVAATPTIEIIKVEATHDTITFDIDITDIDLVGELTNIKFYQGETLLNGDLDLTMRNLTRLTSETEYTIKATYTYDLNDGIGEQTIEATLTVSTLFEVVPILELNGEATMILFKDAEFTNPGAVITNEFDLNMVTTSNVDTSTVGSYIMTYTVDYNNQAYGLLRDVLVVDLTLIETTTNSIAYTVNFTDPYGVLQDEKLALYQGTTLVNSYTINSGMNTITFSSLTENTNYEVVIEGNYEEYEDTILVKSMSETIATLEEVPLMFTNSNEVTTYDSFGGSYSSTINVVDLDESLSQAMVKLYKGDWAASSRTLVVGDNYFDQGSLEPETEYILKVEYTYTPQGSSTPISETIILSTFTISVPKPDLELVFITEYTYGFDYVYGIDETGFDDVGVYVVVKLDGVWVSFYQPETPGYIEIDGLSDGNTYTLELYADYNQTIPGTTYSDVLLDTRDATTEGIVTFALPTIDNLVITKAIDTENSVTLTFDLTDLDNAIFGDTRITISNKYDSQQASEIITVGTDKEVVFSGSYMKPNEMYTIKVYTDYHEDGETSHWSKSFFEQSFAMIADVTVTSLDFEQSMYFFGDQIIMKLELDNGSFNSYTEQYYDDVNIEYVTINGDKYYQEHFFFPSSNQTIYLNMGVETDYTDYTYHMTDFAVTLVDESSYVIAYDQTNTFRLHQPGDIIPVDATVSVLNIEIDDHTQLVREDETDYAEIKILLDNPFDLDVFSVTVGGTTYPASQFNTGTTTKQIKLSIEIDHGTRTYWVSELVYTKDDVDITADIEHHITSIMIYGYYAEDVILISTPEGLNSIDPNLYGKYYKLTMDIDLTGIDFVPIRGVSAFDGNGHTISNLSLTYTVANPASTDYIGLFATVGFIYDVTLSNVNISVTTDDTKELAIGALAGRSDNVLDSHLIGDNLITVNGMNQGVVGGLIGNTDDTVQGSSAHATIIINGNDYAPHSYKTPAVGGLIGSAGYKSINTSSSSGSITITNTNYVEYNVGGLIGEFYNYDSFNVPMNYIFSSYSSVDISSSNNDGDGATGGLVGRIHTYYNQTTILNSYASGDVYALRGTIGVLIGDGARWIENSFAVGSVSSDSGSTHRFRADYKDYFTFDCYVYDGQTRTYDGVLKILATDIPGRMIEGSADVYNSVDFYVRVLKWNSAFYDFSNLDIENGMLPTLK